MLDSYISTLAEVTAAWLTGTLRKEGHLSATERVRSVSREPMGAGVGMMSTLAKLKMEADGKLPTSLVIKLPAENRQNRGVAEQFLLYMKEARYYIELAPKTTACSPKMYAAYIDDEQNFLLLMEDVSDYRLGNQVVGATLEECRLCVDELAKLHASFWGRIDPVGWLPHISNSDNAKNMQLGAQAGWGQMMAYFGGAVPEAIIRRKEEYLRKIGPLQARLDGAPLTLLHGDFRMDNLLFGQAPHHHPLVMVDFQGPLKARGIADLGYLMSHSVQTRVRRANERDLVQRYVDGLEAGGVGGYGFDRAWAEYRLAVLYAWTVAVVIAGTLDPSNERGFTWMRKMVERNGIAIEDLACLELLAAL